MMMSRNSVTSYFGKRLKSRYSVHSHRHKSGGSFTKVIELHKTIISEGRLRPKKDLSKQWKGRRCHLPPSRSIWYEGSPGQLCLRRAQPQRGRREPSCHIPCGSSAQGKKKPGGSDQRQIEQMGPPQRKPQGRSGPWILLWCQLTSVSPRPRYRAALSQFASPGSWHTGCSEYPGDIVSFWHFSYLPDKHSCPQQRGIGCFWHRLPIPCIQCRVLRQVFLQCVTAGYSYTRFSLWWECRLLSPLSAPLLTCVTFASVALDKTCSVCTGLPCPPYCPPSSCYKVLSRTSSDSN